MSSFTPRTYILTQCIWCGAFFPLCASCFSSVLLVKQRELSHPFCVFCIPIWCKDSHAGLAPGLLSPFSLLQERFRVCPSARWGATWSPNQNLCPSIQEEPPEDWKRLDRETTGEPQGGVQVLAATGSQCSHQQMPFSSRGTRP